MAKIIYRKGMEGQNKLSCIEGIEISLFNGQKALICPKYITLPILSLEEAEKWLAPKVSEIKALKVEDTVSETVALFNLGSPAANWVLLFVTEDRRQFSLPSLLAAMEIQHQKEEIDALAETIEGADLLRDFTPDTWSCSRARVVRGWYVSNGFAYFGCINHRLLVVPTILY